MRCRTQWNEVAQLANLFRMMSNGSIMLALRLGVPAPPYSRKNAVIIETIGRKSGKVRRMPVGYVDDDGQIIVVAEHGPKADYVRNALAHDGRLRVFHAGVWKDATLRLIDGDAEPYLQRMNARHASFVRRLGTDLRAVEITQS
jgi:deazaflavin-dependent oxidoreductase (nitroreductase family)